MALIQLAANAQKTLHQIVRSSSDARQVRRAQVLLWLHAGEHPDQVADRSGLTRQAVYGIVHRYAARKEQSVAERIKDREHTGRPPDEVTSAMLVVQELMTQSPQQYRYRSPVWTVPLLRVQVQRRLHIQISQRTVRRALHQLRYRFKRPRYVLALRPTAWRQAKGGSREA